jgi:hypothetical protein
VHSSVTVIIFTGVFLSPVSAPKVPWLETEAPLSASTNTKRAQLQRRSHCTIREFVIFHHVQGHRLRVGFGGVLHFLLEMHVFLLKAPVCSLSSTVFLPLLTCVVVFAFIPLLPPLPCCPYQSSYYYFLARWSAPSSRYVV